MRIRPADENGNQFRLGRASSAPRTPYMQVNGLHVALVQLRDSRS
jgi:hypothetical protein